MRLAQKIIKHNNNEVHPTVIYGAYRRHLGREPCDAWPPACFDAGMFVKANSPIKDVADLKGKKVALGDVNSASVN